MWATRFIYSTIIPAVFSFLQAPGTSSDTLFHVFFTTRMVGAEKASRASQDFSGELLSPHVSGELNESPIAFFAASNNPNAEE